MNNRNYYVAPECEVMELASEQVICASAGTEDIEKWFRDPGEL